MPHYQQAWQSYVNECRFFGYDIQLGIFWSLWVEGAYNHLK
jgi:hypothetical protein